MIKSIAILGTAAALAASVTATQAGIIHNAPYPNSLSHNGLSTNVFIGNALTSNVLTAKGDRLSAAGAAFTIESIEMPDGTLASH
jgi:hypothetical protein